MARYYKESNFKKSYIPVILSSALLLVLIVGLGYVIFFMKSNSAIKNELYVKTLGTYQIDGYVKDIYEGEDYDVYISDDEIGSYDAKTIKVTNVVNHAFTDKSIVINNPITMFTDDDNIIIYSRKNAESRYAGMIDLKGNTKWIIDFSAKKYQVLEVLYSNKKSYVYYLKNNSIYELEINNSGEKSKELLLTSGVGDKSFGVTLEKERKLFYVSSTTEYKMYEIKNGKVTEIYNSIKDGANRFADIKAYSITSDDDRSYFFAELVINDQTRLHSIYFNKDNSVEYNSLGMVSDGESIMKALGKYIYFYSKYIKCKYDMTSFTYIQDIYGYEYDESYMENYGFEEDVNQFHIKDVYISDNSEVVSVKNPTYDVLDAFVNDKMKKRLIIKSEDDKLDTSFNYITFKDNAYYAISYTDNSNVHINKYEVKE